MAGPTGYGAYGVSWGGAGASTGYQPPYGQMPSPYLSGPPAFIIGGARGPPHSGGGPDGGAYLANAQYQHQSPQPPLISWNVPGGVAPADDAALMLFMVQQQQQHEQHHAQHHGGYRAVDPRVVDPLHYAPVDPREAGNEGGYQRAFAHPHMAYAERAASEAAVSERSVGGGAQSETHYAGRGGLPPGGYRPYTLTDYKAIAHDGKYWTLGKLGPDLESSKVRAEQDRLARVRDFGRKVNRQNVEAIKGKGGPTWTDAMALPAAPRAAGAPIHPAGAPARLKDLARMPSTRQKALEFAARIPKPAILKKFALMDDEQDGSNGALGPGPSYDALEELEQQHHRDIERVRQFKRVS